MRTVHGVVHPLVDRVNLLAVLLGVDIDGRFLGGKQVVEGGVEDANDFRAFVVDDRLRFLVPENRDSESGRQGRVSGCLVRIAGRDLPAAEVGVRFEVEILDVLGIVQRVDVCPGERINAGKRPS